MTRPTVDEYFMKMAHDAAGRSTCDRAHVGCVLVKDGRLVSTGYNGSCAGLDHCDDVGHLYIEGFTGCQRTIHAEINACLEAGRERAKGCTAFITHFPCLNCAKVLINVGITRIVYAADYRRIAHAATFLNEAGIVVEHMQ